MPQPAKPIAEMNQAEKDGYVMQLQTFLIQLLTQLLTLLKKQYVVKTKKTRKGLF